jgi:hypothetical protein
MMSDDLTGGLRYYGAMPLNSFGISVAFPPLPGFTPLARSYLHTPRILRWMRPRARREYERCVRMRTEAWRVYVLSRAEEMMRNMPGAHGDLGQEHR